MEFKRHVRKPFFVDAVRITHENIDECAPLIGELKNTKGGKFIEVDPRKVPNLPKVFPGYWMTRMGTQIRCYKPRVFDREFIRSTPQIEHVVAGLDEEG